LPARHSGSRAPARIVERSPVIRGLTHFGRDCSVRHVALAIEAVATTLRCHYLLFEPLLPQGSTTTSG
jgi:hypothetical protein